MSICNSKAYLMNMTDFQFSHGNLTITPKQVINFWDTKTVPINEAVFANLDIVNVEHEFVRGLIEDGYVIVVLDDLELTPIQFMNTISLMVYQYKENRSLSDLLSSGLKTDSLKDDDGRQIVTPSPIGVGWNICFVGADDDKEMFEIYKINPFAPSGRSEGKALKISVDGYAPDPYIEEFSFVDPIHVHDAELNWGPDGYWDCDDHFSVGVRFAATTVTPASGNGNCNLYPIFDGYNLIIPAAGDGYYNVDLTKACPIRSLNKTGFWNVQENDGSISAGEPGISRWDLYDFAPADVWFMRRISTSNALRTMQPESYRTEFIHPSWRLILSVTKVSSGRGWLTGWFTCFRRHVQ